MEMNREKKINLQRDVANTLAYQIEYSDNVKDRYDSGIRRHYIQCFGRNPKKNDIERFCTNVKNMELYKECNKLFLLSTHGKRDSKTSDNRVCEENYEDYIANIQNVLGEHSPKKGKRIIISGAFPDYDEIYKNSLTEAVIIYTRQIIRNGYTLVFGAHPTFQQIIFDIGELYSSDVKDSIEMHMSQEYADTYDLELLNKKCSVVLSNDIQEMRKNMICRDKAEMLICLGGKLKDDPSQQGVDIEVEMARKCGIPVALVGTVGGRSSEYAYELLKQGKWEAINSWGSELNEGLFYNVNHRLMVERLLRKITM